MQRIIKILGSLLTVFIFLSTALFLTLDQRPVYGYSPTIVNSHGVRYPTISTSKGVYYNATAANAQAAIYSLNNATGWVNFNHQFINLTTSLKLGNNCEIFNFNFSIGNNVNKTMLINYNTYSSTVGNKNIYIHDGILNGNGLNQPLWWTITGSRFVYAHGIQLYYVSNSQIDHVTVKNTASTGILVSHGVNNSISYCNVYKAAKLYDGSTYTHWWGKGIMYDWVNDSTISNCNVDDAYSGGIIFESPYAITPPVYAACCHGITVSGCNVKNSEIGFYTEAARDSIITGCTASYCRTSTVYHGGVGFDIIPPCYNILISDCIAEYCGTTNHTYGSSFIIGGYNHTISDCKSMRSNRDGYRCFGYNINFVACSSNNEYEHGFLLDDGNNISISDSNIKTVGTYGILILLSKYCNIDNNHITSTGDDAIRVTTGNNSISNNVICGATDGIDVRSANNSFMGNIIVSCTNGIDEGTGAGYNIYMGNNAWRCTNSYDINTVTYLPYPQVNFSNFNRGTWT